MSRAIVLMYHHVGIPPKGVALRSLYVTPRMFRFQMWYLKNAGFRVVCLNEICSFINGDRSDEKLVAITFDDGYQDFYDHAYPVLRAYNFPSTVFLVSDLIGKENLWDAHNFYAQKKLLDWTLIGKLQSRGVFFGSHTKTHPFLTSLSADQIDHEVRNSKTLLEERLHLPVEFFCYPYGDYDNRVISLVEESGYKGAVTTKRGLVHRGDSMFEIRRSFIRLSTHPLLFAYKLHSNYEARKGLMV